MNLSPETIEKLVDIITKRASLDATCDVEDFNIYDYCGGNYDDAYEIGMRDGEIFFASALLSIINENKGT